MLNINYLTDNQNHTGSFSDCDGTRPTWGHYLLTGLYNKIVQATEITKCLTLLANTIDNYFFIIGFRPISRSNDQDTQPQNYIYFLISLINVLISWSPSPCQPTNVRPNCRISPSFLLPSSEMNHGLHHYNESITQLCSTITVPGNFWLCSINEGKI